MARNVTRMVAYTRDPRATGDKFAGLAALIHDAKARHLAAVLVDSPKTLGDTQEELTANLDALAAAELSIIITLPRHRSR